MPRHAKAPRLLLRKRPGREAVWVILDRGYEKSTGCLQQDHSGALAKLGTYLSEKHGERQLPTKIGALSKLKVVDILTIYMREHAPTKPKSLSFLKATSKPVAEWWARCTLADVNAQNCIAYVNDRVDFGDVSDQTARHDLKTLRAAINYYHANHGPLDAVPIVTLPARVQGRIKWLFRSEMAILLWRSRQYEHVKRMTLIGRYTGTRSGATLGLHWIENLQGGWIDMERGVIHRKGVREVDSKKKRPPAKIHRRLMLFLRRWYEADMALGITSVCHWQGSEIKKMRRSWETVRKAAGLGEDVTPHVLRHTRVTWLLQEGLSYYEVGGSVGMSAETVEKVYGHHHPEFQKRAANSR